MFKNKKVEKHDDFHMMKSFIIVNLNSNDIILTKGIDQLSSLFEFLIVRHIRTWRNRGHSFFIVYI